MYVVMSILYKCKCVQIKNTIYILTIRNVRFIYNEHGVISVKYLISRYEFILTINSCQ